MPVTARPVAEMLLPAEMPKMFSRWSDYLGAWAIEPTRGMSLFQLASRLDMRQHIQENQGNPRFGLSYVRPSSRGQVVAIDREQKSQANPVIAIVEVRGVMMKMVSSMDDGTSTAFARQQIRNAANDPSVCGILLVWDTPGGTVSGTSDLAAEIVRAKAIKPVFSFGEDSVASAGLWGATQADKFFANVGHAGIGSIGTMLGLYDLSELCKNEGIKALVFATGAYKGAGFEGAPIPDHHLEYFQRMVDEIEPAFESAISTGRKMSAEAVKKLATGEVWTADAALKLGLIDGIQTLDETITLLFETKPANANSQSKRNAKMSDQLSATDRTAANAELTKFVNRFGATNGSAWFLKPVSYEDALELHAAGLESQIATLNADHTKALADKDIAIAAKEAEVTELNERIAQIQLGVKVPATFVDGDGGQKQNAAATQNLPTGLAKMAAGMKLPTSKATAE